MRKIDFLQKENERLKKERNNLLANNRLLLRRNLEYKSQLWNVQTMTIDEFIKHKIKVKEEIRKFSEIVRLIDTKINKK